MQPPAQPQNPPGGAATPATALGQKAASAFSQMAVWATMPDMAGSGPYPAAYEMAPGGLEYVVYQPNDLAAATRNRKLGVHIWGNGGCGADGATARFHLTEIASRGYIAIAPGRILSGPEAPPRSEAQAGAGRGAGPGGGASAEKMVSGPDDVAQPNALDDLKRIAVPVFVADHPGAGHVGLFLEPNGEATKIELDWLAWRLDGDKAAARTFEGADCGLCRDFRWVVYRKGIL